MSRYVGTCTWDEVPHLTQVQKDELYGSYPVHMREARSKGVPSIGSGVIYPVSETDLKCEPFEFPPWWTRGYALDVGWNRTAAIWGARDTEADIVYLYSEYYRGQAEPAAHAAAIRGRGNWMTGAIDPASRGRGQADGQQLLRSYVDLGLTLVPAANGVEAGIFEVYQRMTTGRLKVFSTLQSWWSEFRLYRRDRKGAVVKENDHLMDATRYFVVTGVDHMMLAPDAYQRSATLSGRERKYDPHGRV